MIENEKYEKIPEYDRQEGEEEYRTGVEILKGHRFLVFLTMFIMVAGVLAPLQIHPVKATVDLSDWYSADYTNRIKIEFNTSSTTFSYANDMDDVLANVYLTDSDLLDASDDKEDLLFVALSDAGVPEACYYDAWVWDTANDKAWISVRHFLDKDADTVVYLYFNKSTAGTSGYCSATTNTYVGASAGCIVHQWKGESERR